MKKILVILDGIVAKKLLDRMVNSNTNDNQYDIVYLDDSILPTNKPLNFTFYNFDPTSYSKLFPLISNNFYSEVLLVLNAKDEVLNVIENIRIIKSKLDITIYDKWDLDLEDNHIQYYKALDVLSNGLLEKLPNIPVFAQNIGLREGEIMELKIPFGSSYAYRYVGSIKQKDWKIFGLYRNGKLLNVKPSLVLKPNDIIVIIGKPEILENIYSLVSKSEGQFPLPFGRNVYVHVNPLRQEDEDILALVQKAIFLHRKLHDTKLIIKMINPSTMQLNNDIKELITENDDVIFDIDYNNKRFEDTVKQDRKIYEIGLIVMCPKLLEYQNIVDSLFEVKIPVFKSGIESLESTRETLCILNDANSYEQIGSMIFDISKQMKTNVKVFNMDPIGDSKDTSLIEHFENLATIFAQEIKVISDEKNPIKELQKEENILHILPLKKDLFKTRYFKFATLDTDLLSYDNYKHNQILIPVIENNQD
jgi:hypothetical protein